MKNLVGFKKLVEEFRDLVITDNSEPSEKIMKWIMSVSCEGPERAAVAAQNLDEVLRRSRDFNYRNKLRANSKFFYSELEKINSIILEEIRLREAIL